MCLSPKGAGEPSAEEGIYSGLGDSICIRGVVAPPPSKGSTSAIFSLDLGSQQKTGDMIVRDEPGYTGQVVGGAPEKGLPLAWERRAHGLITTPHSGVTRRSNDYL